MLCPGFRYDCRDNTPVNPCHLLAQALAMLKSRRIFPLDLFTRVLLGAGLCCFPLAATALDVDEAVIVDQPQAEAVLHELREIRQLLEKIEKQGRARAPTPAKTPSTATLRIDGKRPALGSADAPVTVVEFTDYQCPFCRRFAQSSFPLIKRDYIDTGKVRWQVRDLPLNFHPDARKAAQAALCADEQGQFWRMRDSLFRNSANLGGEHLKKYASELELDMKAFASCMEGGNHLADIDKDIEAAKQMRITGTPTFVIGKSAKPSMTGKLVIGAQSPAVLAAEIKRLLEDKQQ
jgi:protein-disulfide isomerase